MIDNHFGDLLAAVGRKRELITEDDRSNVKKDLIRVLNELKSKLKIDFVVYFTLVFSKLVLVSI